MFTRRWRSAPATDSRGPGEHHAKAISEVPGLRKLPLAGSVPYIDSVFAAHQLAVLKTKMGEAGADPAMAVGLARPLEFWPAVWSLDGVDDITTMGILGIGTGLDGTFYTTCNPEEFMAVLRGEGRFPSGGIEMQWFMKEHFKRRGLDTALGLMGRGETWQRTRRLIQRELLAPAAAKSYGDAIGRAAALASRGAPLCAGPDDFDKFVARASFDMFAAGFLGRLTRTANPADAADPEDVKFCEHAAEAMASFSGFVARPSEMVLNHLIPGHSMVTTSRFGAFQKHLDAIFDRGATICADFVARRDCGELDVLERMSYMHATLARQGADKDMSAEQFAELASVLLMAAVDTTAAYTKWVITALAIHQDAQQKVADELRRCVGDGPLTTELLNERRALPYLNCVKRETHRLRPAILGIAKTVQSAVQMCGYDVPSGTVVTLDTFTAQNDPQTLPDAAEFRPERWSDAEVEARRGTAAAVIDHPLLRGPFSAGARQCPAARVANIEVLFMAAELVRNYRIRLVDPPTSLGDVNYVMRLTMNPATSGFVFEPR